MNKTTLHALAEPNRLKMIELIRDAGPLSVGEIALRLELGQPQTSKHLRVLRKAGLVEVQRKANRRMIMLRAHPLQELDIWLQSFQPFWDERVNQMNDYLQKD